MPIAKKIFDYGIWVVFFAISTYASLFYVTKDAIPGDFLYGTKLGVEKVLIASSSLLYRQVDFQIDFVTRRFDEVTKVLASQYGIDSLVRLDSQVVETAESIANIKDPNERKKAADKFITELSYISDKLDEEEEKYIQKTLTTNTIPTVTPVDTRWYNPLAPQPTSGAIASSQNVVDQIDSTQNTISSTITSLETIKEQTNNSTGPTPTSSLQKTSEFKFTETTPTPTMTPVPTSSTEMLSGQEPTNSPTPTIQQPTSTPKPTPTCAHGQSCYQQED